LAINYVQKLNFRTFLKAIPELDGKTAKMYRGGKICMTDHFKPLWARNVPKFGIAHAMALGVSCFYSKILSLRFLQIKQNFEF
jgi:hypothetical protein